MKEDVQSPEGSEGVDQNFETALEEYLNAVVAAEKEEYHSDLRPFSAVEREIRDKVTEAFRFFQKSFSNGYQTLVEELAAEMKMSETKEDLLALVEVEPEKLEIFDDSEALVKALEGGNSIYELLGYSEKSLNAFYHAVHRLIEEKDFKRARDVCYFLTIIAPDVYQFWVYLGRCDANLEAYETAFEIFLKAIDTDPTNPTAYLDAIDLLAKTHDFNKASSLCSAGLHFAAENQAEPWSEPLRSRLEEKMNDVTTLFNSSQNHPL